MEYIKKRRRKKKMISEWIRFILGSLFLLIGIVVFLFEIFGIFKFKYVLNRMHAAAMGDTLAFSSCLLGLAIISGFNFDTLKIALILVLFWVASPVSSHVLAKMEVETNDDIESELTVSTLEEVEKKEAEK